MYYKALTPFNSKIKISFTIYWDIFLSEFHLLSFKRMALYNEIIILNFGIAISI